MKRRAFQLAFAFALACPACPSLAADEDQHVAAFRAACMPDRRDFDLMIKRAEAEGWTPAPADAHPALKSILDSTAGDVGATALRAYRKDIGGHADYLIVQRVASGGGAALIGCNLYDFEAVVPLGVDSFSGWLGITPTGVVENPKSAFGYRWDEPRNFPGAYEIFAIYLFEGSEEAKDTGFSGQVIKITSIEAKKP